MTFNIIYTPHSVSYLSFFVKSLLDYSMLSFRLISNGCSNEEELKLIQLSNASSRLSFFRFPSPQTITHGAVLNLLQSLNQDEFFCFMDSDIFAIHSLPDLGDFFIKPDVSAIFSGIPIWASKKDLITKNEFNFFFGTNNEIEDKRIIGGSYFAIYKNNTLSKIREKYKVGFERIKWSKLSIEVKRILEDNDLARIDYDTGKLINSLMLCEGWELMNKNLSAICHIGGISIGIIKNRRRKNNTSKSVLESLQKQLAVEEFSRKMIQRDKHKKPIRSFFLKLFESLTENKRIPVIPNGIDEEIKEKLEISKRQFIQNFNKYYLD